MKKIKQVQQTRDYVESVHCDLCGKIGKYGEWQHPEGNYYFSEVNVSFNSGSRYPEGGMGEKLEFDICPDCFTNKLVPFLNSEGAKGTKTEWDW